MTHREFKHRARMFRDLQAAGISEDDCNRLRRISMTLHRWDEAECGNDRGCICRDDDTGRPYWQTARGGKHVPIPDREAGALKRLKKIMANYPALTAYHQGDCRGAALYILRHGDIPSGEGSNAYYTRGICVY